MSSQIYRVVLDTNQVVAAGTRWIEHNIASPDSNVCRRILIQVAKSHTGLYCGKIVGEYLEKLVDLGHPKDRSVKLIAYLMGAFSQVTIVTKSAPFPPADPDDEVFLLCAIDGQADYLVSDDQHLTGIKASYSKPIIGNSSDLAGALGA